MREALAAELFLPVSFDLAYGIPDRVGSLFAAGREGDAFRAAVVRVGSALQVAASLELAEEVVDRLLAHPSPGGEFGGSCPLRPGIEDDVQMGRVEVVEAMLVQTGEHPSQHLFPWHPQERADQGRPERLVTPIISKAT